MLEKDERIENGKKTENNNKRGNDLTDPTSNVLMLVEAAVKRLDDLHTVEMRRVDQLHVSELKRIDQLREAETIRVNEQMQIRAEFAKDLALAEAKRIDAIRAVDVNAVSVANDRATQQAIVLANQVAQSAETLRALVAQQATANATQLSQIITPLTDRLALLEKSQYENKGKSGVADPQMEQFMREMRGMVRSDDNRVGKDKGMSQLAGWLVSAVLFIISIIGFIMKFG